KICLAHAAGAAEHRHAVAQQQQQRGCRREHRSRPLHAAPDWRPCRRKCWIRLQARPTITAVGSASRECHPSPREESMRSKRLWLGVCAGFVLLSAGTYFVGAQVQAQAPAPVALTGQITSDAEATMEGVVVSAKKAGSTVTISVISDAQGRYRFPADRLDAGKYTLKIRAIGYDLA